MGPKGDSSLENSTSFHSYRKLLNVLSYLTYSWIHQFIFHYVSLFVIASPLILLDFKIQPSFNSVHMSYDEGTFRILVVQDEQGALFLSFIQI